MEYEDKKIIHEEMRRKKQEDCSKEALMMINKAIEYMETRQGQIGGIIMSIGPSDNAKDKHAIGAMAGSMLKCGNMLLTLFQELFERMDEEMIAYFIHEFMDTIPDNKKSKILTMSMEIKEKEISDTLEEIMNRLKDSDNE